VQWQKTYFKLKWAGNGWFVHTIRALKTFHYLPWTIHSIELFMCHIPQTYNDIIKASSIYF
jgi:hypothetical protein